MSGNLDGIVDADLYFRGKDEEGRIDFQQALEYANRPLDRSLIEDTSIRPRSIMGPDSYRRSMGGGPMQKMREEYFEHASQNYFELTVEYESGDTDTFKGGPRTDLRNQDFLSGIFPSIIPFNLETDLESADPDQNPDLVLREMRPYDDEMEKHMVSEVEFAGEKSYDHDFSNKLGSSAHAWLDQPDNFSYVDEPRDFIAMNGFEGYNQKVRGTEVPSITVSDWKILDLDEKSENIIGLRPFYHDIWDAGLNNRDPEMLGQWTGANRGIGRWIHDMDDEFFYGSSKDNFIGFYDNEMPFAVGSDKAFEMDIRHHFFEKLKKASESEELVEQHLKPVILEEEEKTAAKVDDLGLEYYDLLPRNIESRLLPEDLKADKLF